LNDVEIFWTHPFGDGIGWLFLKACAVLFMFLWIRATFPRYRYDQMMRLCWKVFIPVTLVWGVFLGVMLQTRWSYVFYWAMLLFSATTNSSTRSCRSSSARGCGLP